MKKNIGRVAAVAAITGMLLTGCASGSESAAPAADSQEQVSMTLSSFFPEDYPMGQLTQEWADAVSEATDGRVTIDVYASGSLTPSNECYQGVVDNISDICHTALTYTPGRFPVMEVLDIPGYEGTGPVTSQLAHELYQELKPAEMDDVEVMFFHAHPPGVLMMGNGQDPVTSMEDLKGKVIRTTGLSAGIYERFGSQIMSLPAPEIYDPLSRGVVDGTVGSFNNLKFYRHAEVTSSTTVAPSVGYVTSFPIVMNKSSWEKFTAEEQEKIRAINDEYSRLAGERWDQIELEGAELGVENGHKFYQLTPEEEQRWFTTGVQPVIDAYIEGSSSKGFDGAEVWEKRQEIEDRLLAEFPAYELPMLK